MEIVDAQVHEPRPGIPWEFGPESHLALAVELTREAMDSVGVDAALINASDAFCDAAVHRYPTRFAGCGRPDPLAANVEEFVATYRQRAGMLALRVTVRDWREGTLTEDFRSGAMEPLFAAAEEHMLPLFLSAQGQPKAVAEVAQAHPGLLLIVDHLGLPQPPPMRVAADPWEQLPEVNRLATFPNVAIKFSGALTLSRQPYPHSDIWPYLETMIEAFTPDRLMWGSDFTRLRMAPRTNQPGPRSTWAGLYGDSVSFLRDTEEISKADKQKLFGATIRRLLRWPKGSVI